MRTLLHSIAVPATAALVLLSGCGSDVETAAPAPSASAQTTSAVASGRTLTAAEVHAAIPPLALLPDGWKIDPSSDLPSPADAEAEVAPARCQALFDQLHEKREEADDAIAADADEHYRSDDGTRFLSVVVESYESTAAEDLFGAAARALADCPRFRSTEDNDPAEFKASPLSFSRYGDETLALRFVGTAASRPFTLDFVAVRVDRTTITAQEISYGGTADPDLLSKVVSSAVRELPED
jgi:uncharacterized protein YceK